MGKIMDCKNNEAVADEFSSFRRLNGLVFLIHYLLSHALGEDFFPTTEDTE